MRKIALITGGSRGIGAACVRAFAEDGYSVVFLYNRSEEKAQSLVQSLRAEGRDVAAYHCDLSDPARVRATLSDILRIYHRITGKFQGIFPIICGVGCCFGDLFG